jgi:hypothetical protein
MIGPIAELDDIMISKPKSKRIRIRGSNQNFFLIFKNAHMSFKNSILVSNRVFLNH